MNPESYSNLSIDLTKQLSKNDKKSNGIYFTPPTTIIRNLKALEPYMKNIKTVLEPSCGSCEYITRLNDNLDITGIEFDKTIYAAIRSLIHGSVKIFNEDFLKYEPSKSFDLIIGNPPYFVMKKKDVNPIYYDYFDGRPNIFIMFIIKSLKMLNKNGILSFVLPRNFLNCLYYDKTRKHISQNFTIIDILECGADYIETKQDTVTIIIQRKSDTEKQNDKYLLKVGLSTIFGLPDNIEKLKLLYNDSTTLSKLNFKVNVGNVVWNQVKDILTNDEKKTRLIYSSDIKDGKLVQKTYKNKDKKNFIDKQGITTPLLVVNRGYGVGNYNFNYCLIEGGFSYLIENHLICIKYMEEITNDELTTLYKKIINSLENKKTKQFVEIYFGNNAINTTELCNILPIYQ